jgi:hypothetical protein
MFGTYSPADSHLIRLSVRRLLCLLFLIIAIVYVAQRSAIAYVNLSYYGIVCQDYSYCPNLILGKM